MAIEQQEELEAQVEEAQGRAALYQTQVSDSCNDIEGLKLNLHRVEVPKHPPHHDE